MTDGSLKTTRSKGHRFETGSSSAVKPHVAKLIERIVDRHPLIASLVIVTSGGISMTAIAEGANAAPAVIAAVVRAYFGH